MKIRSRLEFFLAKIAERSIDVKTLIPPGASSMTEKLLLEISDRIDRMDRGYESMKKIKKYLYEIYYSTLDYDYAYDYFNHNEDPSEKMACASVRNGDYYGRNFDWIYDETAEFIIHTPHAFGRYATIGVGGVSGKITEQMANKREHSRLYKILPFYLRDGINEFGVVANMNVVPTDKGFNRSEPSGENLATVSAYMLVRYILDNFKSASDAVAFIHDHMTVYFPKTIEDMGYEIHYMVADAEKTYLVEFINNEAVVTEMTEGSNTSLDGKPYMTNFYLSDVIFNSDGTVYTPADTDGDAITDNNITKYGSGLERYNYIVANYSTADTADGMRDLMNGLTYTKAYITSEDPADPEWYTEFVGINGLTVASHAEDYAEVMRASGNLFTNRTRADSNTWQTVHSVVYDIKNKSMNIIVQEDDEELEFILEDDIESLKNKINDLEINS